MSMPLEIALTTSLMVGQHCYRSWLGVNKPLPEAQLTKFYGHNVLTHCGLVTPYGDIDLGQRWFR